MVVKLVIVDTELTKYTQFITDQIAKPLIFNGIAYLLENKIIITPQVLLYNDPLDLAM